jgi:hypothetical protein
MKPAASEPTIVRLVRRVLLCLVGLGAVAWGVALLPEFWRQAPIDQVAAQALLGRVFKREVLVAEATQASAAEQASFCNPRESRSIAIVRLAIMNATIAAADRAAFDSDYGQLQDAARKALACEPGDGFLWLTLFWLEAGKHGLDPSAVTYLRMSYALAPNDAWVALRRSRIVTALLPQLPPELSERATTEFVKLVDTGFLVGETAEIFADAAPPVQRQLVERLTLARERPREAFARAVYDRGVDVEIPGFSPPTRPWQ